MSALDVVLDAASSRLPQEEIQPLSDLRRRADERMRLGAGYTIAAFAGPTGSGKSSLFNALAGATLSTVGTLRPTTATAQACVWDGDGVEPLLEWLEITRWHNLSGAEGRSGLVLLDLPDIDSTEASHRLEVDRLVRLVDLFVWVVDPQKYADASIHEGYLAPLATHAAVTLVALNQCDRLTDEQRRSCMSDLGRLLDNDGLGGIKTVCTSAVTGMGLDELNAALDQRVSERRAAVERLEADLGAAGARLANHCGERSSKEPRAQSEEVVRALEDVAQLSVIANASERSHLRSARLATGWPVTRWLRRFRPDPIARLGLQRPEADATSLPPPGPAQRAHLDSALRAYARERSLALPEAWRASVRRAATPEGPELERRLEEAVRRSGVASARRRRWWTLIGWLQMLLLAVALVGLLWLVALFVVAWLGLPDPPTYEIEGLPVPTVLLIGGLLLGALVGGVSSRVARLGAARDKRAARRRLQASVAEVADQLVLTPVAAELEAHDRVCRAAAVLRGD